MCRYSSRPSRRAIQIGKTQRKNSGRGINVLNPLVSSIIRVPTRTINSEMSMNLPSKEGLTIQSDVSILYRIDPTKVTTVTE